MPLTLVLSVGADSSVLKARDLTLQSAGYIVESLWSVERAASRFLAGDFDLVILCHTIPPKERGRLVSLIRASGSRTPIVSIAGEVGQSDGFANTTLEDDPQKLIAGIREVLAKAVRPAGWEAAYGGERTETVASGKKPVQSSRNRQKSKAAAQAR